MSKQDIIHKRVYYIGIALAVIGAGACFLVNKHELVLCLSYGQCAFYEKFGIYCPGCGGTRAVNALLHGELWDSFLYHPAVIYAVGIYMTFMTTYSLHLITKGKTRYLRIGYITLVTILAVLLLQWAIKVFLQLEFGYVLL